MSQSTTPIRALAVSRPSRDRIAMPGEPEADVGARQRAERRQDERQRDERRAGREPAVEDPVHGGQRGMRAEVEEVERGDAAQERRVPRQQPEEDERLQRQAPARQARRHEADRGEPGVREPSVDRGVHEGVIDPSQVDLEGQVEDAEAEREFERDEPQAECQEAERAGKREPQRRHHDEADRRAVRGARNEGPSPLRRHVVRTQLLGVHPGVDRHRARRPSCVGDRSAEPAAALYRTAARPNRGRCDNGRARIS